MPSRLESFLEEAERPLRHLSEEERADWRAELQTHLDDAIAQKEATGLSYESALESALTEFGQARRVGREVSDAHVHFFWERSHGRGALAALLGALLALLVAFLLTPSLMLSTQSMAPLYLLLGGLVGFFVASGRRRLAWALAGIVVAVPLGIALAPLFDPLEHALRQFAVGRYYGAGGVPSYARGGTWMSFSQAVERTSFFTGFLALGGALCMLKNLSLRRATLLGAVSPILAAALGLALFSVQCRTFIAINLEMTMGLIPLALWGALTLFTLTALRRTGEWLWHRVKKGTRQPVAKS